MKLVFTPRGTPIDYIEGAAVLMVMVHHIERALLSVPGEFVRVRKRDLAGLAIALRLSAKMVDAMTLALERGDRFAPVEPQDVPKPKPAEAAP